MPNWTSTNYVIEGNKKTLQKIHEAIKHPTVKEGGDSNWEGNVLYTLNPDWDEKQYRYMRGFIGEANMIDDTLRISADEAWCVTNFSDALADLFDDIVIYWIAEEPGMEIYQTNDRDGKYFSDRYFVDTCIEGVYSSEYFQQEDAAYRWLSEITKGKIKNKEDMDAFNTANEDTDDYIYIHEFEVIKDGM